MRINLIKIAFANLGRHKGKVALTVASVVVGIFFFLVMDGMLYGMDLDSRFNLVDFETGSAKIYSKKYFAQKDELPLYEGFKDYQKIIDKLDDEGYHTAARVVFGGTLISVDNEQPFMFIGINPEQEKKVFDYYKFTDNPYSIKKEVFQNEIIPKIKSEDDKNKLRNAYTLNDNNLYYYNNPDFSDNEELSKVKQKIFDIELDMKNNHNKLSENDEKKLNQLKRKERSILRILKRDYNKEIQAILSDAEYRKFINNGEFEILLGAKGALDLNVKIGDKVRCSVVVDVKDEFGRIHHVNQVIDLVVSGTINSPNPKINGNIGYLPLDILQDERGLMLDGKITEIVIRKKNAFPQTLPGDDEKPAYLKKILSDVLRDDLTVVSWEEDAKDFLAITATKTVGSKVMVSLLLILAIIGITNTMMMSVFERIKEIGMLRAMGLTDGQVVMLFLYEAAIIGFIGTTLGIILAGLANLYMVPYGLDYTNILEEMGTSDIGYRVTGIFRSKWNFQLFFLCFIFGPVIAATASLGVALKSVKMPITDCLRFE